MAKQALKIKETTELARRGGELAEPINRLLTREEFQGLAQVPPEVEWFANIQNPRTKRAGSDGSVRDLGEISHISRISIFNCTDCCQERLNDAQVEVH